MAKKKKVVVSSTDKSMLKATKKTINKGKGSSQLKKDEDMNMLFGRKNYMWMLAGVLLMALGIILMLGGQMPDNNTWDDSIAYSWRRITLAPIVILTGIAFQFVAIFKK